MRLRPPPTLSSDEKRVTESSGRGPEVPIRCTAHVEKMTGFNAREQASSSRRWLLVFTTTPPPRPITSHDFRLDRCISGLIASITPARSRNRAGSTPVVKARHFWGMFVESCGSSRSLRIPIRRVGKSRSFKSFYRIASRQGTTIGNGAIGYFPLLFNQKNRSGD